MYPIKSLYDVTNLNPDLIYIMHCLQLHIIYPNNKVSIVSKINK